MEDRPRPPRRVRTLDEAQVLVGAWKASGQNKEAWCRSQGILRSALQSCLYRVGERRPSPGPTGFIEVRPSSAVDAPLAGLVLELGHGMRVVGLDRDGVLSVIRALHQEAS
jgi:hypothetical protein